MSSEKRIITISRQYGSGGRQVGALLAEQLGLPFYDKELIGLAAEKSGLAEELFASAETNRSAVNFGQIFTGVWYEPPLSDKVFLAQCAVIRDLAAKGPCLIVGRCSNYVLRDCPNLLNVFIYAAKPLRIKRAVEVYGEAKEKIEEKINLMDKKRSSYFNYYTDLKYGHPENYDLCIDSGYTGVEGAAKLIRAAWEL